MPGDVKRKRSKVEHRVVHLRLGNGLSFRWSLPLLLLVPQPVNTFPSHLRPWTNINSSSYSRAAILLIRTIRRSENRRMTRSTYPSVAESHGPRGPLSATTLSIFSTMLSHPSTFRLSSAATSDEKRRESIKGKESSMVHRMAMSKVLDNEEPSVHVPCFLKK